MTESISLNSREVKDQPKESNGIERHERKKSREESSRVELRRCLQIGAER
jgi:hypothetical protein